MISSWSRQDSHRTAPAHPEQIPHIPLSLPLLSWTERVSAVEHAPTVIEGEDLIFSLFYTLQHPPRESLVEKWTFSPPHTMVDASASSMSDKVGASEANTLGIIDAMTENASTVGQVVERLAATYALRGEQGQVRAQIAHFLTDYPAVADVLLDEQAIKAMCRIFPPQSSAYLLHVQQDPDINNEQMVLTIAIDRDRRKPRDGIERLMALEDEGVLDADERARGKLTVILGTRVR